MIPSTLALAIFLANQLDHPPGLVARIGSPEFRHLHDAYRLSVSADGKRVYTIHPDFYETKKTAIYVWDAGTGRLLAQHLIGQNADHYSQIGFGADGVRILANIGGDYQLRIVDPDTGKTIRTNPKWKDPKRFGDGTGSSISDNAFSFSPNVDWMIWSNKNSLHLTAATTGADTVIDLGQPTTVFIEHGFSADDRGYYTVQNGVVRIFELPSGKPTSEIANPGDEQRAAAFTPDGKQLLVWLRRGDLWSLDAWDIAVKSRRTVLAGLLQPGSVTFAPDGKRFALVHRSYGAGDCEVRDFATGKEVSRMSAVSYADYVHFSPDCRTLYARPGFQTIVPWDVATGLPTASAPNPLGPVTHFRFNAAGKLVGFAGGAIYTWDPLNGKELTRERIPRTIDGYGAVAFSPTADRFHYTERGDRLVAWDFLTGTEQRAPLDLHREANSGVDQRFTPDGSRHVEYTNGVLIFRDPATGKQTARVKVPDEWRPKRWPMSVSSLALLPDGRRLAIGSDLFDHPGQVERTSLVAVLNLDRSGKPAIIHSAADVWALAFSPDGRFLTFSNRQQPTAEVGVLDTTNGRRIGALNLGSNARIRALQLSPDGRMLAASLEGRGIRLIETATWQIRASIFNTDYKPVAWSPGGERLATPATDGGVMIWDVRKLGTASVGDSWAALASDDAPAGFAAIKALAATPQQALSLLKSKITPVVAPNQANLKATIEALGSDEFQERERATADLANLARLAEPALRRALQTNDSPEVTRRIRGLLERLGAEKPTAEEVRAIRAVEAAEWMGTPEAVKLLEVWAGGAEGVRLTTEAKAALTRSKRR